MASSSDIHAPVQQAPVDVQIIDVTGDGAKHSWPFAEDVDLRSGLVGHRENFQNIERPLRPPVNSTTTVPLPPPMVSGSLLLAHWIIRQAFKRRTR